MTPTQPAQKEQRKQPAPAAGARAAQGPGPCSLRASGPAALSWSPECPASAAAGTSHGPVQQGASQLWRQALLHSCCQRAPESCCASSSGAGRPGCSLRTAQLQASAVSARLEGPAQHRALSVRMICGKQAQAHADLLSSLSPWQHRQTLAACRLHCGVGWHFCSRKK